MSIEYIPATHIRMTRTADGEGGFTESAGSTNTIYVLTEVHDNRLTCRVRREADIKIGDQIYFEQEMF